jgi:hypothetical protein
VEVVDGVDKLNGCDGLADSNRFGDFRSTEELDEFDRVDGF